MHTREVLSYETTFRQSVCDLTIYQADNKVLVIATERKNNPGPSITNSAEYLWKALRIRFPNKDLTLIEHYSYDNETFDQVIVENNKVRWKPLNKELVAQMIAQLNENTND